MYCYHCGKAIETIEKITREAICPHCDVPLHACFNCAFYDANAYHQCKEPQAEYVNDKTSANFCEYFKFSDRIPPDKSYPSAEARRKLDELFKR